ncbi:hypothetical protein [Priestia megaterium]|uniref:hypothetical protein n=1 Tax=Priestia megaterium TaxID=1404 RepID=UPI000BFB550F|nr:hypothetical protein [Priestia megaterium]PGO60681.1 hypothetical protein CN981_09020 [Priestia megaterium]
MGNNNNFITWHYNRLGHVEIYKGIVKREYIDSNESDLLLQNDYEVQAFFSHVGYELEEVYVNDFDHILDYGLLQNMEDVK